MTMLAKVTEPRVASRTREGNGADGAAALGAAAALFHGLADPTRLLILRHLYTGEHRVKDLTEHLGLAQSTVSAHLSCLRDCGLVVSRPQGRASMFSLAAQDGLANLLEAAEALLAGNRLAGNRQAGAAAGHLWRDSHTTPGGH